MLTTSLGLGSGDYVPGLDLHLNSMLGETDLLRSPLEPGERMQSMMAPSVVLDRDGPLLAIGAAGGTRLRTALVTVAAGVLDEGLEPQAAVDRDASIPRERSSMRSPARTTRGWRCSRRKDARSGAGRNVTTTSAASA